MYCEFNQVQFKNSFERPLPYLFYIPTHCVLRERLAMIEAVRVIVGLYRRIAPQLAKAHEIHYPLELEQVMLSRLHELTVG